MNPEDFDKLYEGYEKSTQLELDLDDYNYSLDNKTYTIDIDSSATSTSPSTVTFGDFTTTAGDVLSEEIKAEEFNARLDKMEKMLGIIKPDEVIEEKYPHIKELREKYEKELEAVMTFEYLDPKINKKTG
jgi:hypothetical protein